MKNDGGSAFPSASVPPTATQSPQGMWYHTPFVPGNAGMTLRDYFAAKAMQGMLATPAGTQRADEAHLNPDLCAEWAYQQADAMLKARGLTL